MRRFARPYFRVGFLLSVCLSVCLSHGWGGGGPAQHLYMEPLVLTDADGQSFLETSFEITPLNKIRHWLKNNNDINDNQWKYTHFKSHSPFTQKRATLLASLQKIQYHASDKGGLSFSARKKIKEFLLIGYPIGMIRKACNKLAASNNCPAWLSIRNDFTH